MGNSRHDAPSQMYGYLYQIERALYWLSNTKEGGKVGIETGDDVVAILGEGENPHVVHEQDKTSISKGYPYSDLSKDLWNTLKIWLTAVKDGKADLDSTTFFLVTNRKLPSKRLVWEINKSGTDRAALDCCKQLRETGQKAKGKLSELVAEVLSYDDQDLSALIKHISVLDGSGSHDRNSFKKDIRSNFHISKSIPFHDLYSDILGWILGKLLDSWSSNTEAWINVDELNTKVNDLISDYNSKPFIEKAVASLKVSDRQRLEHKHEKFVSQLELVNLSDEVVLDAIDDFLRASWERTRYAKAGRVSKPDFDEFEYSLTERWKEISRKEIFTDESENEVRSGRKIYFDTINHKGFLKGIQTERDYTTKGAYHKLSNNLAIGWHPKWKELMNKEA